MSNEVLQGQEARQRPPVLADVARIAGVSIGSASKALNNRGRLSPDTRKRVRDAAEAIGFRVNIAAAGLVSGRTGTVGLLTNDLVGRFSLPILMGAEDALGAGSLSVLLCDARGDAIREQFHLRTLLERRVDGIILVGESAEPRPSLGADLPVPVVYAYSPSIDDRDISITSDDTAAGRLAAQHLLDLGRTRLAYLGGDVDYLASAQRSRGALSAISDAGLSPITPPLFGTWSEEWGRSGAQLILDRAPDVDAIVCGSDQIARGVLDTLLGQHIGVPDQVAVIGHDNWEPIAAHAQPPLTTIDMRLTALGKRAAEVLFQDELRSSGQRIVIPSRVEVRRTTS